MAEASELRVLIDPYLEPRIHKLYLDELAKLGVQCRMGEFMDERALLERMKQLVG